MKREGEKKREKESLGECHDYAVNTGSEQSEQSRTRGICRHVPYYQAPVFHYDDRQSAEQRSHVGKRN